MCTVTYIPGSDRQEFTLTSNRDERISRSTLPPKIYDIENMRICYPRDARAGGTWIAMNDRGRIGCLLNGAFVPHTKEDYHTHSRGQVLLALMKTMANPETFLNNYDLSGTEPFTIITLDVQNGNPKTINESIWDGKKLHYRDLETGKPYIWSSVTLYDSGTRKIRVSWFNKFIDDHPGSATQEEIFDFHSGTHTHDVSNNLVMKRTDSLKTVSITQVVPTGSKTQMKYLDLENQKLYFLVL